MSLRRIRELSRSIFVSFMRDPAAVFFTLVFPLLFLFIFGGIFGGSSGASRIGVLVAGSGPVVDQLPTQVFDLKPVDSLQSGIDKVNNGDEVAVVAQDGDTVTVRYQASDQVGGQTVVGVVNSVVDQANLEALGGQQTYQLEVQQVEDTSLRGIEFVTPGLLAWAVSIGAVFGGSLTLVNWRTTGVLRRLRLTPAPAADIVVARVLVSLAVAVVQTALFLAVGTGVFDLHLASQWWMVFPLVIVGTLAFLSIGLLVGAVSPTVEAASALSNLIVIPMSFLSGAFIPLDSAPSWLRTIASFLPLTHLLEALTDELVRGRPPSSTLANMGILLLFGAVFVAIATRVFRWDRT